LGLQHNVSWRWQSGLLGSSQQPWAAEQPKGSSQLLLSPMERRYQPGSGPRECWPWQPTAWQRVLGKFPRSQHRPSLKTPPRPKIPAYSDPVKHWNFRKADCNRFCLLSWEFMERLPLRDATNIEKAYQKPCTSLLFGAKQSIKSVRQTYVPCWDNECEAFYRCFLQSPVEADSEGPASSLLSRLDQQGCSTRRCPAYKVPRTEGDSIFCLFTPGELATALSHWSPGLDSIFPEFILHARSVLKSWLCDFITSCMHQLKIPWIWRIALVVAILSWTIGIQGAIAQYLYCVSLSRSSSDSSTLVSNQSSSITPAGTGGLSAWEIDRRSGYLPDARYGRIAFRLRRLELSLLISQQPTTPCGVAASPASYRDCYLTGTWSAWSWRLLAIAALPLLPVTTNAASYEATRTASTGIRLDMPSYQHLHLSLKSRSSESIHMPMI